MTVFVFTGLFHTVSKSTQTGLPQEKQALVFAGATAIMPDQGNNMMLALMYVDGSTP